MKPAKFEYFSPTSLDEVLDLLAEHGPNAKILAGGQSLIPTLNFRLGHYDVLIDINRVDQLSYIRTENGALRVGAMTRQRTIETSSTMWQHAPLVAEATKSIAHLPIRTRGTIGGSLSHADPAAEYPAVMLVLEGEMVIQSRSGERSAPAVEFFEGPLTTVLQPDELLVEIRIPAMRSGEGFAFEELSRRRGDFAIVGMAAAITVDNCKISRARFAACGLGFGPVRFEEAERLLEGEAASPALIRRAARLASSSVAAQSDLHADAEYRLHLVEVLFQRTADRAVRNAMGGRA